MVHYCFIKDSSAIQSVFKLLYLLARVADGAESPLQGIEVIHLLETDDVGLVPDELLQDPPPPHGPAERLTGTGHKVVTLGAQRLGQEVPLKHPHTALTRRS